MICPFCQAENGPGDACSECGHLLLGSAVVRRGTLVAGRYEVLNPVGRGGMGMVYKAHDRLLDEVVALKVLRPDMMQDADVARRFRLEFKLARRVRHRNVCGIHDYNEDGGLRYICMEYVEGLDLKQLLRQKVLLPVEAYDLSLQIAEGLHAIHEAGIIHRDLKTSNIMRTRDGMVRLMDFGIAKQFGVETTATMTGQVMGTPEYISPEQARGERVEFRSDVYALGVVVFEVFTGDVPFRGGV
jgi:eukaryotic-like serine/threonine-protein kinase